MKYKVGDKVKLKSKEGLDELKRQVGDLYVHLDAYKNAGSEQTILECNEGFYRYDASSMFWHESLFEGLVEEEVDLIPKFGEYSDNEPLDIPTMTTEFIKEHGLPCPNGYIFKDENGNVINATKIVLEKKKPKYPQSYEECCYVLDIDDRELVFNGEYRASKLYWKQLGKLNFLNKLLICRDAYWKIAGEEMGLGKPWEPTMETVYCVSRNDSSYRGGKRNILEFPTAEMRDAFYEAFKELIEICKEFL